MMNRNLVLSALCALSVFIARPADATLTPVTPLGDQRRENPEINDFTPYAVANGGLTAVAWSNAAGVCRVVVLGADGIPINPNGTVLPGCGTLVGVMWDGSAFRVATSLAYNSFSRVFRVTTGGVVDYANTVEIDADIDAIAANDREFFACSSVARACWFVDFNGGVTLLPVQLPFDRPSLSVDGNDFLVSGFDCPSLQCADRQFRTLRVSHAGVTARSFNDVWGLPPQVIFHAAGKHLAVWRAGFALAERRIVYAFLDDFGQPVSAPADLDILPCCSTGTVSDDPPSVTFDGQAFVAVWSANESRELRAARISPAGAIIEKPFVIDKATAGKLPARNPAITSTSNGLRLAWTSVDASGINVDVYRQAPSARGLVSARTALLATALTNQSRIRVSAGAQSALAVWYEGIGSLALHAAPISPGGVAGPDSTFATLSSKTWSPFMDVAAGRDGYLAAWTAWPNTYVARFDSAGSFVPGSITTLPDTVYGTQHPLHERLLWDGSQYVIAGTRSRNQLTLQHVDASGTPIEAQPQLVLPPVSSQYGERSQVSIQRGAPGTIITWREYESTPFRNFRACGGRLTGPPWSVALPQCHSAPEGGDYSVQSRSSGDDVVMFWRGLTDRCLWAQRFKLDGSTASEPVKLLCDVGQGISYDANWSGNEWLVIERNIRRIVRFDQDFHPIPPGPMLTGWPADSYSPAFGGYILAGERYEAQGGGVSRVFFQLDVPARRRSAGQ